MKTNWLTLILFILVSGLLTNCNKEKPICSNETDFCALINAEDYIETGVLIDNYLRGLNSQISDEQKLEQLKNWLECKNCVSNVEITCISCIETEPPKSLLKVLFMIDGQQIEKTLYVLMGNPLRFDYFD